MKKNLIYAGIAAVSALGLAACGGKSVKNVKLASDIDSVSYAFGVQNADQALMFLPIQGRLDTTNIDKFVKGFLEGVYGGESKDKDFETGKQIGADIRENIGEAVLVPGDSTAVVNKDAFVSGFVQTLQKKGLMTSEQASELVQEFFKNGQRKQYAERIEEQNAFLEENKKQEDVQVTESGLQYKIVTAGNGEIPAEGQTVKVNYRGTLTDGTEFDSSYKRNQPFEFNTSGGVIDAWLEAAKMMPVGSKWIIYCPSELAYGDSEVGQIPPYSTLIFEIEMLEIVKK